MSVTRPARVRAAPARLYEEQESMFALATASAAEASARSFLYQDEDGGDENDEESEEEEEKGDDLKANIETREWSTNYSGTPPHPFRRSQPSLPIPDACTTPLDFFHLFCTETFVEHVVRFTNAYGEERAVDDEAPRATRATATAAADSWQDTNVREIKALFGCLIYMGIVCLTDVHDYWARDTLQSFVADTFTRDRFLTLLRRLRFNTRSYAEAADRDPLHPFALLTQQILRANLLYFTPGRWVVVDEAMVGFKGRSYMIQHIATKAEDTGFKVWMLVDCESGFVVAFDIYTGVKRKAREENASANVVLKLAAFGLKQPHHVIVMDNYFSSVYLFRKLLQSKQYAIGTTQSKRKHFPKHLFKPCERRGEFQWRAHREETQLTAYVWEDKKSVHFLSSCTNPEAHAEVERREGAAVKKVTCPKVVPDYIQYMRGVDLFSQRRSYSKVGRKSRKYFYALIWYLVDVVIHNAYILWQTKHNRKNYNQKDFRKELMRQLVGTYTGRHKAASKLKRPHDALHRIVHAERAGSCQQCRKKVGRGSHNARSVWRCGDCDVFLCMPDCYNKHIQALVQEIEHTVDE